jgi:diaminopimelate decarboxylase
MFNIESEAELDAVAQVAGKLGKVAPIALRINPDVDPKTHRYISTGKKESKFGLDIERAERMARSAAMIATVRMIGIHMHIGSQITSIEPYENAVAKGVELIGRLRKLRHPIEWYNMGGGYGINYKGREARPVEDFARAILPESRPPIAGWRSSRGG